MKKNEEHLTYFCDLFFYFFIARGVQLDNGVDPPWWRHWSDIVQLEVEIL